MLHVRIYLKHFPPRGDALAPGRGRAARGLATGLVHHGARVTILCEARERHSFTAAAGYTIECFDNPRPYNTFRLAAGLRRHLETIEDGTTLLVGTFHPPVNSAARLLRRRATPHLIVCHDPFHPQIFAKRWHLKWPYFWGFERPMLRAATALQLLDSRHQEWVRRLGIGTPCIAVPCGHLPEEAVPESDLMWRGEGPPVLGFLGRIDVHNKGLDLLVEAFADLGDPDTRLTIQGPDWGDRQSLEALVARRGLERVTLADPDFKKSPRRLVAAFDVFCLPSRFEGFGLSALDAMLAGRVLLVSDIAGIAPHVEASGCGVVVQPDVASIRDGLHTLVERRPEWREMGLRGRQYALEHLSWSEIARGALEAYRSL